MLRVRLRRKELGRHFEESIWWGVISRERERRKV